MSLWIYNQWQAFKNRRGRRKAKFFVLHDIVPCLHLVLQAYRGRKGPRVNYKLPAVSLPRFIPYTGIK